MKSAEAPRGTTFLVGLAALTVVTVGMSAMRGILAPVLLTLILTVCAHPVRTLLQRKGVPQGIATGSVVVVMFASLTAFVAALLIAVGQFANMLPVYAEQFAEIGAGVVESLGALGIDPAQAQAAAAAIDPSSILNFAVGALGGVFSVTGALVIILTMMILMSADAVFAPTILEQLGHRRPHLVDALRTYASNVRRYMVVTTLLGIAQGLLNAIALWALGVPAALLWGMLAFLCSFIPNVGYFVALVPPLVFGYLGGGWPTLIAVLALYALINAVVQSVIQPRVVGQAVALSQTVTFFSVLFWAFVIGPIGAILAIPLTLFGKAILVDADPEARSWAPALGADDTTRELKRAEDAQRKQRRKLPDLGAAPGVRPAMGAAPRADHSS